MSLAMAVRGGVDKAVAGGVAVDDTAAAADKMVATYNKSVAADEAAGETDRESVAGADEAVAASSYDTATAAWNGGAAADKTSSEDES